MGGLLFTRRDKNSNLKDTVDSLNDPMLIVIPVLSDIIESSLSLVDKDENSSPPNSNQLDSDLQNLMNDETDSEQIGNSKNKKRKKKFKGFFLFSTQKKKKDNNSNSQPKKTFLSKLNSDIIKYNDDISQILSVLQPLKEYIISKIKLQVADALSGQYKFDLEVYGSFKSELDIESSDIDIMFNPLKKKINCSEVILSLSNHFLSLNIYEKVIPIYTATIPLIKLVIIPEFFLCDNEKEFEILSKYQSFKLSPQYINYQYDKNELDEIKIDITFPMHGMKNYKKNTPHLQVEYIRNTLQENSEIKPTVKILKRMLQLKDLNNSYKGGLSSYSLFLLVYAFLKHYNYQKGSNHNGSNVFANILIEFLKWYSSFQFYYSFVDASKDYPYIQFENFPEESDGVPTIIDPITMKNAGKSSFNIIDVEILFGNITKVIEDIKTNYENGNMDTQDNNLVLEILREMMQ